MTEIPHRVKAAGKDLDVVVSTRRNGVSVALVTLDKHVPMHSMGGVVDTRQGIMNAVQRMVDDLNGITNTPAIQTSDTMLDF